MLWPTGRLQNLLHVNNVSKSPPTILSIKNLETFKPGQPWEYKPHVFFILGFSNHLSSGKTKYQGSVWQRHIRHCTWGYDISREERSWYARISHDCFWHQYHANVPFQTDKVCTTNCYRTFLPFCLSGIHLKNWIESCAELTGLVPGVDRKVSILSFWTKRMSLAWEHWHAYGGKATWRLCS